MAEDYAENLFQAVDTIVNERIKNLPYDRTIRAKIYDNSQAYYGLYQVTTNDVDYFNAYSDDISYNIGDEVYVRIPKAEYTEQKVIISKYIPEIEIKNTDTTSDDKRFYIARPGGKNYINYVEHQGNYGHWVNSNVRLNSYQLFLYNDPPLPENGNIYSPDDSAEKIYSIQAVLVHYVSKDGILYEDESTIFTNGHYMVDNGTTTQLTYSQILDGQYAEITEVNNNKFNITFTPNRQFVHPYAIVQGYVILDSGTIIISNPLIFNADEKLSSKYRSFTLTASNDQFFIYNATGRYIPNSGPTGCIITFEYNNTLKADAPFTEDNDSASITIERLNNPDHSSLLEWGTIDMHTNNNKATLTLQVKTNEILSTSFYVERLAFKITKKGVTYILNKDFYFGYKQIDSDINSTSLDLYLNDNDWLKYQKLLVGENGSLINISSTGVTLGGQSLNANGNWEGNAATATTSINLAEKPILSNDNKQLKITIGDKTSDKITVAFAQEATDLTNSPSFTANNDTIIITVGGKTSTAFTVPFATNATNAISATKLTVNGGSATCPVYFKNGVPTVTNNVKLLSDSENEYDIINALKNIIKALNNNVATKSNRTIWQGIEE